MAQLSCDSQCEISQDRGAFYVAPCDTIPRDEFGKPIVTDELLASMRRLDLCGPFDYAPDVTTTRRKKFGGCGGTSCTTSINGFDITLPLEICQRDDVWVQDLVHPHRECQFDFIMFPWPENCAMPVATDYMWVGSVKSAPSAWNIDPDSTDPFVLEVTAASCNYPLCTLNDVTDIVAAPLNSGNKSQPLNVGKEAA